MLDHETMVTLGKMGAAAALGLGALGSALGCGTAGMSAIAVWKKAYAQGKSALFGATEPFLLPFPPSVSPPA